MFRNKEIRQFCMVFSVIAAVTIILGFASSQTAGFLAVLSGAAYGTIFFLFTNARYKNLQYISEQIDRVLHNTELLLIDDSEEGELSILKSEISKMMLRIQKQNDALKKEKMHLADSLADIAHQLRTPLTSAHLILSLLEKNPEEQERKTLLRETEELFTKMEWLINSLLKLSRLDAGIIVFQSMSVDVNGLIHTAIRPLLIAMELHHITLEINVPDGMNIQGDPSWLSEAIENIVKNCIQCIDDYGKIEISCEETILSHEIKIRDNGPGFAKEDLPHIFERFYRGKNDNASGYGIGLALCKLIISRHGGTITARNLPEKGAVFCIRFPK